LSIWQIIQRLQQQGLVYVTAQENVSRQTGNNLSDISQLWEEEAGMEDYYTEDELMFDMFGLNPFGDASLVKRNMYPEGSLISSWVSKFCVVHTSNWLIVNQTQRHCSHHAVLTGHRAVM
jgi:hypothetical protein